MLRTCDICVLPYYESSESGSAAANICLATAKPLVVSISGIFDEIREFCHTLKDNSPSALSSELIDLLKSQTRMQDLRKRAVQAIKERNWDSVARLFLTETTKLQIDTMEKELKHAC
jgi:glycosyltransferase involved in cell wall biosynthesis